MTDAITYPFKTYTVTVSWEGAQYLIQRLMNRSAWFAMNPENDKSWTVTAEHAYEFMLHNALVCYPPYKTEAT